MNQAGLLKREPPVLLLVTPSATQEKGFFLRRMLDKAGSTSSLLAPVYTLFPSKGVPFSKQTCGHKWNGYG